MDIIIHELVHYCASRSRVSHFQPCASRSRVSHFQPRIELSNNVEAHVKYHLS